jgi:hypothetical protein
MNEIHVQGDVTRISIRIFVVNIAYSSTLATVSIIRSRHMKNEYISCSLLFVGWVGAESFRDSLVQIETTII